MTCYVQSWRNYVNLGKLYSAMPWGTVFKSDLPTPSPFRVNVGSPVGLSSAGPSGWGYFEDGSVYVALHKYLSHEALEARMKIAAHFVSYPSPRLQAIREQDAQRKRLIVIG